MAGTLEAEGAVPSTDAKLSAAETAVAETTDAPAPTPDAKVNAAPAPTTDAKPSAAPAAVDQPSPPKKRKAAEDHPPDDQSDTADGEELVQKSQEMLEAHNPRAAVKLLCRAYPALRTDLYHAQRCVAVLQAVTELSDNDDNRNAGFHAYHKSKTAEQEKEVKRIQRNIKLVEELLCLLDGAGYKDDGNLVEGFKKRRTELQV